MIPVFQALRSIILKGSEATAQEYEQKLSEADAERKKEQKEFQAQNAPKMKEIKEQIDEISAQIKIAPPQEKGKLGQKIKALKQEIEALKTPQSSRFSLLDSEIKAYAGSQLLFKPMLNAELFDKYQIPYETDKKGRLLVDQDFLRESELGNKIRSGADYIFGRTKELNDKMTQVSDIKNIISMDAKYFLKKEPKKIDFELIEECHNAYETYLAEQEKIKKDTEELRQTSQSGINLIKTYENGYAIYELMPTPVYDDNGNLLYHISLKYESDQMGHCVGRGGYDKQIGKEGWHFYSLRIPDKNGVLIPHCTISIENGRLAQIKGNSNTPVKLHYIPYIRDFVKSLGMETPASEKKYIGYVYDQSNQEVDLFNLPKDVKLQNLNLSAGDYKGIDLKRIADVHSVSFEGAVNVNDFRALSQIRHIDYLILKTEQEQEFFERYPLNVENLKIQRDAKIPENLENIKTLIIENEAKIDSIKNLGNVEQVSFRENTILNVAELPNLKNGISGGIWGDVSQATTKELLSKMYGSEWLKNHYKEQNGQMYVDCDVDFSDRGLNNLPQDIQNLTIYGVFKLKHNKLDDINYTIGYPQAQKMELDGTYAVDNRKRYDTLPDLPLGISNLNDKIYVGNKNIKDVIQKFDFVDKKLFSHEGDKLVINGDVDFQDLNSRGFIDVPKEGLEDIEVKGILTVDGNTEKYPLARKVHFTSYPENGTMPDSVEEVNLINPYTSDGRLDIIKGKNLKKVSVNYSHELSYKELRQMSPNVEYCGYFQLRAHEDDVIIQGAPKEDYSRLKINGELVLLDADVSDRVSHLPQSKVLNIGYNMPDRVLAVVPFGTGALRIPTNMELTYLPDKTHVKYVSNDDSSMDFAKELSSRGLMWNGTIQTKGDEDQTDILTRYVRMEWSNVKNISNLPQCEELRITSPNPYFDSKFLKDASPYLKKLDLSYMKTDHDNEIDFSVLPKNVQLENIDMSDGHVQKGIFTEIPDTVKTLHLLRCNSDLDYEALNRNHSLEELDLAQMNVHDNFLDKVNPERLETLNIGGDLRTSMRAKEILAIHHLPETEDNNKIKQLHDWMIKEGDNIPYTTKQVVFYKTATEVLQGKHPQTLSQEEIVARVKSVENYKLNCASRIIMAEERIHKIKNDKAGWTVLDENKDKKPGYYNHASNYHTRERTMARAGKMLKTILTHNVKNHPDYEKVASLVEDRINVHIVELKDNFNGLLATEQEHKEYVAIAERNKDRSNFKKLVERWRGIKER